MQKGREMVSGRPFGEYLFDGERVPCPVSQLEQGMSGVLASRRRKGRGTNGSRCSTGGQDW